MEERALRSSWVPPDEEPAEALWERVLARLRGPRIPRATYRVQLNSEFTFAELDAIVPYLAELGVSDVYASPFFKAQPGSMHGYDLVDHNTISPAIGTRERLEQLSAKLTSAGMGLVLDFVPNHMGVGTFNAWWMDVLENGPSSLYAPFFDIDWAPLKTELRGKVLLPVLGEHYGRVLEGGELVVRFEHGAFFLGYHETVLPVNPRTYPMILEPMLPVLEAELGPEHDAVLELQSIITNLHHLPPRTETKHRKVIERRREKEVLKRRLAALTADAPAVQAALEASVANINGVRGDPRSFDALDAVLEQQSYRLSFWRVAAEEINYRRFFDINELAAIRMENPAVFEEAHRLLFELLGQGVVGGLRIDHPDGLWDPPGYFSALQRGFVVALGREAEREAGGATASGPSPNRASLPPALRAQRPDPAETRRDAALLRFFDEAVASGEVPDRPVYIIGEKILSRGERLPDDWLVHGTTGYEFAITVGAVFVDASSESAMTEIYQRALGQGALDFESLVYQKKKLILRVALASELNVLAHALNRLSERSRHSRDFTLGALTDALREVVACFPVYRTYVNEHTEVVAEHDRVAVIRAIRMARRRNPTTDASVYAFLRSILLLELADVVSPEDRASFREFVMKLQQLTGPVMAKGLEDTAFYIFNRLVSLNEVGGEPERYGRPVSELHRANAERQRAWPSSMLATSTHDTKRSEDVRARVSVLSELPEEWSRSLDAASAAAAPLKTDIDGQLAPDRNEEYLFFQTLIGSWPTDATATDGARRLREPAGAAAAPESPGNPTPPGGYEGRMIAYMRKATKEGKVNTSWIDADPEYDAAVESFVRAAVAPGSAVLAALAPLAEKVAFHGRWGALSQALLKLTSPGVPDVYQGTELWDDSLVDPDNRRRVDYPFRARLLRELRERSPDRLGLARELVDSAADGRIKMWVTHVALALRAERAELFGEHAAYVPREAEGSFAAHVVSYSRRAGDAELCVVAPRLSAALAGGRAVPPIGDVWMDTVLPLTEGSYEDAFTGVVHTTEERDGVSELRVAAVLAVFPVALLVRRPRTGGGASS